MLMLDLTGVVFARFFFCKLAHYTLWKEATMCSPNLMNGDLCSPSFRKDIDINCLGFLCAGDCSFLI